MWTTPELALKGMNGLYDPLYNKKQAKGTQFRWENIDGLNKFGLEGLSFCTDYYSNNYPLTMLANEGKYASDLMVRWEWLMGYTIIHGCNDAIANLHKAGLSNEVYQRYMCEAKFLRAWAYHRLNTFFMGVPIYLEPVNNEQCTRIQSTADEVWQVVLDDLNDIIANPNFPDNTLSLNYGRPSKGAAYALRGKTYLWMGYDLAGKNPYVGMPVTPKTDQQKKQFFEKAVADFKKVADCGYGLWNGEQIDFFKPENEKDHEMIFPIQYDPENGFADDVAQAFGARDTYGGWTEVKPSADFVDYFQKSDGTAFKWENVPGLDAWNTLRPKQRAVFFLRDGLKTDSRLYAQKNQAIDVCGQQAFNQYYLDDGNEARIRKAYENRDPRLKQLVVTPYDPVNCYCPGLNNNKVMVGKQFRWPLFQQGTNGGDFWLDKRVSAFYCYRKWVPFEKDEVLDMMHCHCDFPLLRYTDIYLNLAEALVELDRFNEAKTIIDQVRNRAHMPVISLGDKEAMREAVRYERRVELCGEAVNFLDEMRWGTYKQTKFQGKDIHGGQSWWGDDTVEYKWYYKDILWPFNTPQVCVQRNADLLIREGWVY